MRQRSPELLEQQRQRGRELGRRNIPRIGPIENRIHGLLVYAQHKRLLPVPTGWFIQQIYPVRRHWRYATVRKACETFAIPVGRGTGWGYPTMWTIRPNTYFSSIRERKLARTRKEVK